MNLDLSSPTTFSLANARIFADLSERAYHEATVFSARTDAECLIVSDDTAIVVAFRGSEEIRDWLQDGKFWQTITLLGHVHAGFYQDILSIVAPLFDAIKKLLAEKPRTVFFIGHSLGGALAPVAADLFLKGVIGEVGGVYTFGEPRVGGGTFSSAYNQVLGARTFRVVNEYDLVPHLPPPGLLLNYSHHQQEVMLRDSGGLLQGRSLARKLCTDGLMLYHAWRLLKDPLSLWDAVKENHVIATYQQKLAALVPSPGPVVPSPISALQSAQPSTLNQKPPQ